MAHRVACRVDFSLFRRPVFVAAAVAYALYRIALPLGLVPPLFRFYLADLLCMPLVLTIALFVQRAVFARNAFLVYTPQQVGLAVLYCSVMFEGVLPHFMERYTADWWDVLAYAAGGVLFQVTLNKPAPAPDL